MASKADNRREVLQEDITGAFSFSWKVSGITYSPPSRTQPSYLAEPKATAGRYRPLRGLGVCAPKVEHGRRLLNSLQ